MREMEHTVAASPNRESSIFDWDQKEYMIADLIDAVQLTNFLLQILLQKDAKNPKKPKKPEPYHRPGQIKYAPKQEKKFATTQDLKNLWG